ncbi:MAG: hypothetical protein ACRD0C_19390 [Acidimicrobiia bacterium]
MNAMIDRAMDYTHLNRAALVSFFAFLFFFFGCGDAQLPDEARSALGPRVEAVRAAAAAGDRTGAQAGVDQLRDDLSQLRAEGVLGEEDATRVLDAVDTVEARLALLPTPTTTTTAPPPVTQDGDGDEDGRKGKGRKHDD